MAKKDRELLEWQLKEKEIKAKLQGLEDRVKKFRGFQASPKLSEPSTLMELPALRGSLLSLNTVCFT